MAGRTVDPQRTSETGHTFANVEETKPAELNSLSIQLGQIKPRTAIGDDNADFARSDSLHRNVHGTARSVLDGVEQKFAHRLEEENADVDGFWIRQRIGFDGNFSAVMFSSLRSEPFERCGQTVVVQDGRRKLEAERPR
jgi:hypothetical protein